MYSLLSDDEDLDDYGSLGGRFAPHLEHGSFVFRGNKYAGIGGGDDEDEEEEEELLFCRESSKLLDDPKKGYADPESTDEKIPYPKSVFCIIGNELCERFSYYGMKTILTLYLKYELLFNDDKATIIYHVWAMMCYFTPLLGAIIADTFLGRFRTIFYISLIYVLGNAVLSVSAITPIFPSLNPKIGVAMTGLFLIALGTGGIKPCVSAFGGDQFVLPQQEKQLTQFFSIFYFSINTGSLLSTYTTPLLRDDVKCFGGDCYALAFGVPAVLMVVALVIFMVGSKHYVKKPPGGNILMQVMATISHAFKRKRETKEKREHWLDHADDRFSKDLISDVKVLLKVLLMYIPLPVFWALFDQQGSRWTLQATRMDGEIGGFTIKPDQMQVINPLFILMMIPIFDAFVYKMFAKCNLLKRQLPRMFVGGVLAGVAFVVSGLLELKLETTYPVPVERGETRLTFINTLPCNVTISPDWDETNITLPNLGETVFKSIPLDNVDIMNELNFDLFFDKTACGDIIDYGLNPQSIWVNDSMAYTTMITARNKIAEIATVYPPDEIEKPSNGMPKLRMLYNLDSSIPFNSSILLRNPSGNYDFSIHEDSFGTEFQEVEDGIYKVFLPTVDGYEDSAIGEIRVKLGGVYNFLIHKSLVEADKHSTVSLYTIVQENSVHMLWVIPQYFILTVSEVMFSITGLEFSFTQAPASMKSVLQAAWLLTTAIGNLIVVIVAEAKFFDSQAMEFFLFAGLMFVDMLIFAGLAYNYKYVDEKEESGEITDHSNETSGRDNKGFSDDETKL